MISATRGLRCRQIGETDMGAVVSLLARGFPARSREFWRRALAQLIAREMPPGLPKVGYILESNDVPVGVILLICSTIRGADTVAIRCNLSSWYVEPEFRAYATLLVNQALRHKSVTYLNVSPAPHTELIIEAQGFKRYCDGVFIAIPMLRGLFRSERVRVLEVRQLPDADFDPREREIMFEHAVLGCTSLWCVTSERVYPFVFRRRAVKAIIPCAQMVYCRDIEDFVRFAGPIGRFLGSRGELLVMIDANGPIRGLSGRFFPGRMPKYFRGPQTPRLGDLAFTEIAMFGF